MPKGSFLDEDDYPWQDEVASAFGEIMCKAYPSEKRAREILRQSGVALTSINFAQAPKDFWTDALETAARGQRTRLLARNARRDESIKAYHDRIEQLTGIILRDEEQGSASFPRTPVSLLGKWRRVTGAMAVVVVLFTSWAVFGEPEAIVSGHTITLTGMEVFRACGFKQPVVSSNTVRAEEYGNDHIFRLGRGEHPLRIQCGALVYVGTTKLPGSGTVALRRLPASASAPR